MEEADGECLRCVLLRHTGGCNRGDGVMLGDGVEPVIPVGTIITQGGKGRSRAEAQPIELAGDSGKAVDKVEVTAEGGGQEHTHLLRAALEAHLPPFATAIAVAALGKVAALAAPGLPAFAVGEVLASAALSILLRGDTAKLR